MERQELLSLSSNKIQESFVVLLLYIHTFMFCSEVAKV